VFPLPPLFVFLVEASSLPAADNPLIEVVQWVPMLATLVFVSVDRIRLFVRMFTGRCPPGSFRGVYPAARRQTTSMVFFH